MSNYIKHAFKGPAMRLYPISCLHVGAPQCDMKFITQHLKRIKDDPIGYWVYMGDGGECVTKESKGSIYDQILSPNLQMECLVDLLAPLAKRGLLGVRGNHGHRIYKETGLSFDHTLCQRLNIPYMGAAAMANFKVGRSSYDIYFHHGVDSGIAMRAKISKAEHFNLFVDADAIFTAHSHVSIALQPAALLYADNDGCKTGTRLRYGYICGSGYDSRTGYAEDRGYPPLLPSMICVEFDGRIVQGLAQKGQQFTRWASDGQHTLDQSYILDYLQNARKE